MIWVAIYEQLKARISSEGRQQARLGVAVGVVLTNSESVFLHVSPSSQADLVL